MKKLMIAAAVAAVCVQAQAQVTNADRLVIQEVTKFAFIAQNDGTFVDLCVQAGIVKAAAAHANQAQIYANWSKQENYVCNYLDGHMQPYSLRSWAHTKATTSTGKYVNKPQFYSDEAGPDRAGKPIMDHGKQVTFPELVETTDPAKEEWFYKKLLDGYLAAVPEDMR
jgi:hypothetical protein